jgi:hypothetical protein
VAALQPATDAYCDILLNWGRTRGVDIFYDRSSIPQDNTYSDDQLRAILGYNVGRSHVLVSFLSPEYIGSSWCRFEYETKAHLAPREIHKVYWKPEITGPLFTTLARLVHPIRTRFLLDVVGWERICLTDHGHWRDTNFKEWVFLEDKENPYNFSDLTEVYRRGFWAGAGPLARCAQKTAEILCREHPDLLGGEFAESCRRHSTGQARPISNSRCRPLALACPLIRTLYGGSINAASARVSGPITA